MYARTDGQTSDQLSFDLLCSGAAMMPDAGAGSLQLAASALGQLVRLLETVLCACCKVDPTSVARSPGAVCSAWQC